MTTPFWLRPARVSWNLNFKWSVLSTMEEDLLHLAEALKPDVVILDIAMPQLNGLDAGEQLRRLLPSCKLVFMTMNMEPDVAAEAFRRGASGYVVKRVLQLGNWSPRSAVPFKRNPICLQ